jgi:hypothetical protein
MYSSFINSKIGYDYYKLDTVYDIVDVNYEGLSGMEISNIYTLKVLKEIIDLYKTILKNVEGELLSVQGKVVLFINRDFDSIQTQFVNIPMSMQRRIKKLLMKNCVMSN